MASFLRVLIVSHDNDGLSHTLRTLAIAAHIVDNLANSSVLVLTDLAIVGRLKFPRRNVDYVHLPGITHNENKHYAQNLNIEFDKVLKIRRKITQSVIKTFKPNLMIVERNLAGATGEMNEIFSYIREKVPQIRIVWGLQDIVGDQEATIRLWNHDGVPQMLNQYCDEIWIYGIRELFDQVKNYQLPAEVGGKFFYTGYLRFTNPSSSKVPKEFSRMNRGLPLVLVTGGSGFDANTLVDTYLTFLEKAGSDVPFQSLILVGPMMRSEEKRLFLERAQKLPGVVLRRFSKHLLRYLQHAQLVICTGGYNTLCELLSFGKKAIVFTSASAKENFLRARIFHQLGLTEHLNPDELTPELLGERIKLALSNGAEKTSTAIPLDGLDHIIERMKVLTGWQVSNSQSAS
jgi:predicted glycosyltransferase